MKYILVFFFIVANEVGGWSGLQAKLTAESAELEQQMMHTGSDVVTWTDATALGQAKTCKIEQAILAIFVEKFKQNRYQNGPESRKNHKKELKVD